MVSEKVRQLRMGLLGTEVGPAAKEGKGVGIPRSLVRSEGGCGALAPSRQQGTPK